MNNLMTIFILITCNYRKYVKVKHRWITWQINGLKMLKEFHGLCQNQTQKMRQRPVFWTIMRLLSIKYCIAHSLLHITCRPGIIPFIFNTI